MKTEIFPMGEEHLDSLAELEKICFSQPWSRQALADELENDSEIGRASCRERV